MKLARYIGNGVVEIVDEAKPALPPGGILIQTEASGLCSGELMAWYMERKLPHVLGHELCGIVLESEDERFPVGSRVTPHHHAPCMNCRFCYSGRYVHCPQWRRTKLIPGGMCEFVAVPKENLIDTYVVNDLRPRDAALLEPLACVVKSIARGNLSEFESVCVIGLGVMGLMHLAVLGSSAFGTDTSPLRVEWAKSNNFAVSDGPKGADAVVVCPGSEAAVQAALQIVNPGGTVVMFAPFAPGNSVNLNWDKIYFDEIQIVPSYSCGPNDMAAALQIFRDKKVVAEQFVSDFVSLSSLPNSYQRMKDGEIVKAMVEFI